MRILLGHPDFPSPVQASVGQQYRDAVAELRAAGFDIEAFCLTLNPPGPNLRFKELDRLWRRGDRTLMSMYERLEARLSDFDVLLNFTGMNLHPRFVERLPVFTVFQCFDDPESSRHLSRPAAAAYDLSLVGNVAEVETYHSWGVQNVEWTPLGMMRGTYDPTLTEEQILNGQRDIDLFMLIDRLSAPRRARMDAMGAAFPNAHFYGRGWPRGFLSWDQQIDHLHRAKIGPNFHNSTGPINLRTFYLPACGVMQICDNKSHLGRVFELDREIVGFDTVDECVELCRYYLAHDDQRREIAVAGWRRAMRDYTEEAVFRSKVETIQRYMAKRTHRNTATGIAAAHTEATRGRRRIHEAQARVTAPLRGTVESMREPVRRMKRYLRRAG